MKLFNPFIAALFLFSMTLVSCNSGDKSVRDAARSSLEVSDVVADPALSTVPPSSPNAAEPPQNAAGVWHYTCAKGCAGGAGAAGTCASCGGALTHNTVYHDTPAGGSSINTTTSVTSPVAGNAGAMTPPITTTTATEPPQNAAGVWHYTCPNGCAGGAGDASACPGCGTTFVHNSGYHN